MQSKALKVTVALIILYGLIPYIYANVLEHGNSEIIDYTLHGLVYSSITIICLFAFRKLNLMDSLNIRFGFWLTPNEALFFYKGVFLLSLISFVIAPWHAVREGLMASISALCRMMWILVAIPLLNGRKSKMILLLSVLLMFLDGSRTFIFIIFIYYFLSHRIPKYLIALGILPVLLVASFRNGFYSFDLLYGIFGEGVNGSAGVYQVMQVQSAKVDWPIFQHMVYTFFQPVLILFTLPFPRSLVDIDSSQFISTIVTTTLGQQYYPMGGFYILSEFIPYGYLGILLFCIYFFVSFRLSSILLDSRTIFFAPALLFMMVKSSPYTYWKWIIWFFIIQFTFKFFSTSLRRNNA